MSQPGPLAPGPEPASRIVPSIGIVVGLGGFTCGLTMLFFGMRAVMDIGGFCAEGGPFEIAHHCPAGSVTLTLGGFWMLAVAAMVYIWQVVKHSVPSFAALLWSALFLALGWNFLEFGLNPPVGDGVEWGWLVCAIVFGAMGGIPAVFFAPWVVRGFTGKAPPRPWQTYAAPPGSTRAVKAVIGAASRRKADAGADGSDVVSQLERLDALHRSGALDDDQYEAAKRRVLEGRGP